MSFLQGQRGATLQNRKGSAALLVRLASRPWLRPVIWPRPVILPRSIIWPWTIIRPWSIILPRGGAGSVPASNVGPRFGRPSVYQDKSPMSTDWAADWAALILVSPKKGPSGRRGGGAIDWHTRGSGVSGVWLARACEGAAGDGLPLGRGRGSPGLRDGYLGISETGSPAQGQGWPRRRGAPRREAPLKVPRRQFWKSSVV